MLSIVRELKAGGRELKASPKITEIKDYPLFQLQQAFQQKTLDVKQVLTLLRENSPITACPTKDQLELLACWANIMCGTNNAKFDDFILLVQAYEQQQLTGLPLEALEAKDADTLIEAYRKVLDVHNYKKKLIREMISEIVSMLILQAYREESVNPFETWNKFAVKDGLKKFGKNDLGHRFKFNLQEYSLEVLEGEISLIECLNLFKKNWHEYPGFKTLVNNLLLIIDQLPDEVQADFDINVARTRFPEIQFGLDVWFQSLNQAFTLCVSCLENPVWIFLISKEQMACIMAKLILAMGVDRFNQYLNTHTDAAILAQWGTLSRSYQKTNYCRIAHNTELLKYFLLAMKLANLCDKNVKIRAIIHLLDRLHVEVKPAQKEILSKRIIELMQSMKAADLLAGYVFEHLLHVQYPTTLIKAFLSIITSSDVDLNKYKLSFQHLVSGQQLREDVFPIQFYYSRAAFTETEDEFLNTVITLIQGGVDPTVMPDMRFMSVRYQMMVNEIIKQHFQKSVGTEISNFINRDPSTIVISYLFKPASSTAALTTTSPVMSPGV